MLCLYNYVHVHVMFIYICLCLCYVYKYVYVSKKLMMIFVEAGEPTHWPRVCRISLTVLCVFINWWWSSRMQENRPIGEGFVDVSLNVLWFFPKKVMLFVDACTDTYWASLARVCRISPTVYSSKEIMLIILVQKIMMIIIADAGERPIAMHWPSVCRWFMFLKKICW